MPDLPSFHAFAAIVLAIGGLYLFATDRYGLPTSSLAILLVLTLGSYLFPYPDLNPAEFFANFGDEALVTVCTMLLLVKGLDVTGALRPMTTFIGLSWQRNSRIALPATLIVAALCSGFVNDTPLMAILFPVVLACAQRSGTAPSQVLLPLNYAVLIGGMATTVGTSTNLLALGIASDLGVEPFDLFDMTPPVIFAGSIGLVFVWLASGWLLPSRRADHGEAARRIFSAVLHLNKGGYADGRTVNDVLARTQSRMQIERIQRGDDLTIETLGSTVLAAGDRLYLSDSADRLKEYEQLLGATLYNAGDLQHPVSEKFPLDAAGQQLAEVVITRGSPLYQRVLDIPDFLYRYRLLPLALHRGRFPGMGEQEMTEGRLRAGDVILAQGTPEAVRELKASGSMLVLDGALDLPRTERARTALIIVVGVMATHALGIIPISVGALLGVALMLATRCLQWRHIPQALNTSLIMVMVASLCLALALIKTGAALYLADLLVALTSAWPVPVTLALTMLAVAAMTNFITNNAVGVLAVPVALGVARQLGAPDEAFLMAVIFGANMPFAAPFGYHTNTMIMSAGGYTPADYARIGVPLTLIMLPALTLALSVIYDL